ncbi:MAG: aldo/keto reductase [Clostridiales bacterium]|nr:aldo/keto reductase [Clostridiales bacterium]
MQYQVLGKTGFKISSVFYGGVVSSKHFDKAVMPGDGQAHSDAFVGWAIDHGINYFDVAPAYGDAQELLGNSLVPYRKDVFLACKTTERLRKGAEKELMESLRLLHTDYFDIYQMHGITTMEDIEQAFGPGGIMELMVEMQEKGVIRQIGFTAHGEKAALKAIEMFDFASVLFPVNWHMHMAHGMAGTLIPAAKAKGMGVLGMKSMIERAWDEEERYSSKYPKSWCKPFDIDEEPEMLKAAVRYTLSLGVDSIVPPGNFDHFKFAVENIDELLAHPITEEEKAMLAARLELVKDRPFLDASTYTL